MARIHLSLTELKTKFRSGLPLDMWRAPQAAAFDISYATTLAGKAPTRTLAILYAKSRTHAKLDMCANGVLTCPLGAPPSLVHYSESWGGFSVFSEGCEFGAKALTFAKKVLSSVAGASFFSTQDPAAASCAEASTRASLVFVHDRDIARLPEALYGALAPRLITAVAS